ncbi:hybrid sensor histidine kinase/response regulator [Campylobacter lari]|uniref:hybrid sensor histidine kinase/response regulator n=1 Tax=unclassified Campylobacter TaxID=2593542 RepID=UPI00127E58C7|nr:MULTISPECIES: chemotaxis protein CheW [unclassified Campylobacter]EAJ5677573.1 hybrid sensor histidine kinase/response regulator [Campylobacter lari]EAJ6151984.1 hybrid sensor histidine kinase/response regulator [Campylobacter lari]EAK0444419.1 hybrid sensor histidine kinase/response regulator [Campylobacter lari]EAK5577263.1 hybrid sensor histidine kinase/response regulator [Campylobacter lari]EAK9943121.1 hybrid sensor histidine kinase/response regulator [Campylobacter lari]
MEDIQEILEDFLVEAFELVEQIDHDLVELEANPEDLELLNRIFRVAHTVKGSSSFLNFDVLTKLTHHMEDVLNKARHNELKITPEVMDVVLESIDMMKTLLNSIRDNGNDTAIGLDIAPICARLTAISEGESLESITPAKTEEPKEEVKEEPKAEEPEVDVNKLSDDEVEAEIERLLKVRKAEDQARRAEKKKTQESTPTPSKPAPQAQNAAAEKKVPAAGGGSSGANMDQTIRVEVKRLDHLMNLIGELVLGKNRLLKIYDDVEERYDGEKFLEELNQVVSQLSIVTTDIQLAVMKTRMQPIAKVFNKFPRVVRDLGRELGKQMELEISGEETELDKSIVEEIGDPIMHMIRNSCDHGIEDPATRIANGKPEKGTVNLKAYNEGNHIVVEIADDGKGLDADVLKSKAIEKNLITEREADQMSDKEAFALIFKPGFSTAAKITNVSGRGVGMDVVKTNIEKLNGVIEIDSELGKGTVMKLKIPLTLAIIQSLLVGTQEEFYAIPLASVLETVRVPIDDIYTIEGKNVLRLRDEVLSLVRLSDVFGVKQVLENTDQTYVVVIGVAESKLGIIVDTLVGQEEIVIKSMGEYLQNIQGIAGATIRGDGRVTLIIDVAAMMDIAKEIKVDIKAQIESQSKKTTKEKPSDYTVLIVDDSKMDRNIMQKSLEPLGVSIIEATNGVEALNTIKSGEHDIDAVLIDIEMPRMDGYTLAGEIRKYSKYKNLPLVAVTSRTSKSDRLRGVEVGMTEYITKPYSPEYLENVVRKNLKLG